MSSAPPTHLPPATRPGQAIRQKRLLEIVETGLPPFPQSVVELTTILSGSSPDLKKAAELIRKDPTLSSQLLRLCNSPLFGLRSRVISIAQAVTLLGADRLRTMVMTTSAIGITGPGVPRENVMNFWRHSFMAALLSEHVAKHVGYPEKEQAYIAGLLHDIGQASQWMVVTEEKARKQTAPPENWFDNVSIERNYFGLDHCELGGRMASNWNFMQSFVDVLLNHHHAAQAGHDPHLVRIVASAEYFLLSKSNVSSEDQAVNSNEIAEYSPIDERCQQPFDDDEWQVIAEKLELEHTRLLPLVEEGVKTAVATA